MIILLHNDARQFISATRASKDLTLSSGSLTNAFWELAEKFPDDLILWKDVNIAFELTDDINKCFAHELIMASYAIQTRFLPDQIGYIDQLPFVNPDYRCIYPTWLMSTDVGGVFGKTALRYRDEFKDIQNFGYLLNSISRIGQQNGLLCYSDPDLIIKNQKTKKLKLKLEADQLFKFVAQHYKKEWLWVLFFCLCKYEHKFPIIALIKNLKIKSYFRKNISLPIENINGKENLPPEKSIDIIIPTLYRPKYVEDLLKDLSEQTKPPSKVIIVEQDPDPDSVSKLNFLNNDWPFMVVHHFVHRTGACYARNLAMKAVTADYIFFADDDIRLENSLLERVLIEMDRLKVGCINLNCLQPGEKTTFKKIKQWGAFGSGTSIVNSEYALQCRFSELLEFGFGEDIDYGMQLREKGCDIIYHPELKFKHLKAKRGGFRSTGINDWSDEKIEPKPSPTMMFLAKKYYTFQMMKGYKASLFIKFYRKQSIKNPFRYFEVMRNRWNRSEELCDELQTNKAG